MGEIVGVIVGRMICMCMKISCVYRIRNNVNDKCYVGSAINYQKRKIKHLSLLRKGTHHCRHLQNAFSRYGESSFSFDILENVSVSSRLVEREDWWINKLSPEYNIIREGILNHLGLKRSPETCLKISRGLTGKHLSDKTKQKLRDANLGKTQSHATVQKKREKSFKPITQLTLDGKVVGEWTSATDASGNGYNRKCIYRCLWGERPHYKGFVWRYKISA